VSWSFRISGSPFGASSVSTRAANGATPEPITRTAGTASFWICL
jgi:hypothetical protein